MIPCDPQSLMEAASQYRCIPCGAKNEVIIALLCAWVNDELGESCGDPSSSIQLTGAGFTAVNQVYALQSDGSWLSADGLYQITLSPDGSTWSLHTTGGANRLYTSTAALFPCSW